MRYYDKSIMKDIEQLSKLLKQDSETVNQLFVDLPHLQITYGAPGTGKSYGIEEDIHKYGMKDIRTTFHPDSDYSTFVGAYKPQMEYVDIIGPQGIPTGKKEKRIVYKFTKQSFLKAYTSAWKDLKTPYVLVIEELNRGNCAQIFGDLFQLLDYNDGYFSKYPIAADADLEMVLSNEFGGLQIKNAEAIDSLYKEPVVKRVMDGEILILPNNLYIWATMNTSDQSLFPIDSAFKRRWAWKYIPIRNVKKGWKISVNGQEYDWWSFLEEINKKIWDATHSEDKKLGYFFCKADRKANETDEVCSIISADRFVGKVLFYVYNDVFKDYGFDDDIFKDENDNENPELLFQSLFMVNGKANDKKVQVFLDNLKVKKASEIAEESNNYEQEEELGQGEETEAYYPSSPSTIRIQFADETIEESTQFDSYIKAMKKISTVVGMDKIADIAATLKYSRHDCPLVSKEKHDMILNSKFSYEEVDEYYVVKGINKNTMINFLNQLKEELNLDFVIS